MFLRLMLHLATLSFVLPASMLQAAETIPIEFGGIERRVVVDGAESARNLPLVLVLHGNGQRAEDIRQRMNWHPFVEKGEIVVAYPEGVNQAWADGRAPEAFLGRKPVAGVDDVAFLAALVDLLSRQGVIDRKRIYAVGMSNGGLLTYRLLCERSDLIAGGAVIAASMWPGQAQTCRPEKQRPLLVMNGTADRIMMFEASVPGAPVKGSVETIGTLETLEQWRRANACEGEAMSRNMPAADPDLPSTVTHMVWRCPPGQGVELYRVEGGGHRIPALAESLAAAGLDAHASGQNVDLDAAREIWGFFSQAETATAPQRLGMSAQ